MAQTFTQEKTVSCHIEGIDIPEAVFSDQVAFIQATRQGLPGGVVKQAIETLGQRELFVRLLETTGGNLNRYYRRKALSQSQSESILDILRVFSKAISIFGDINKARDWLDTAIPALGGYSAFELCDTFTGRNMVQCALRKIEFGEFT